MTLLDLIVTAVVLVASTRVTLPGGVALFLVVALICERLLRGDKL